MENKKKIRNFHTPGISNPLIQKAVSRPQVRAKEGLNPKAPLEFVLFLWVQSTLRRGRIYEPVYFLSARYIDKTARQTLIRILHDCLENVLLFTSRGDEGDAVGMSDDGQGKCDAIGRRFR